MSRWTQEQERLVEEERRLQARLEKVRKRLYVLYGRIEGLERGMRVEVFMDHADHGSSSLLSDPAYGRGWIPARLYEYWRTGGVRAIPDVLPGHEQRNYLAVFSSEDWRHLPPPPPTHRG